MKEYWWRCTIYTYCLEAGSKLNFMGAKINPCAFKAWQPSHTGGISTSPAALTSISPPASSQHLKRDASKDEIWENVFLPRQHFYSGKIKSTRWFLWWRRESIGLSAASWLPPVGGLMRLQIIPTDTSYIGAWSSLCWWIQTPLNWWVRESLEWKDLCSLMVNIHIFMRYENIFDCHEWWLSFFLSTGSWNNTFIAGLSVACDCGFSSLPLQIQ